MRRTLVTGGVLVALIFSIVCTAQIIAPEGRFESWDEIEPHNVRNGVRARPVQGDTVSFTRVELDSGAKAPDHNHADEQFIYLEMGMVSGYVGTMEYILEPGDIIVIPAWTRYGFEAVEGTVWFEVHGTG